MGSIAKEAHTFKLGAAPAATLERAPFSIPTQKFATQVQERVAENGNHILTGLRVFRTGTFTDMFGFEHTWDDTHLDLMVLHFKLLRDNGVFPDVPVRADHQSSVNGLVGYYEDLYRDPEDRQFLSADIEFTEPDAYEKWHRRTWRSRSIEIGMYESNDKSSYWPVVMGLAFVDIPAVEGLHGRQGPGMHFQQALLDNEESNMQVPDITKDPEGWKAAVVYAAWLEAVNYAQACENWEKAVIYAKAVEDEAAAQAGTPPTPPTPPPTPTPPTPPSPAPSTPPSAHAMPMNFRVNGSHTSDFAAIQTHIDGLEQFAKETKNSGRTSFIEQLAKDNKIAAGQIAGLTAHALSLSDEQFLSFRASYDAAPALSLFGQQAQQDTTPGDPGTGGSTSTNAAQDADTLKEIVKQHRYTGKSEEDIAKLPSYKKLVALGVDPTNI